MTTDHPAREMLRPCSGKPIRVVDHGGVVVAEHFVVVEVLERVEVGRAPRSGRRKTAV
jgi:hypothetical protein